MHTFTVGDRVKISESSIYYGQSTLYGSIIGVITGRFTVRFDDGFTVNYQECDLELVSPTPSVEDIIQGYNIECHPEFTRVHYGNYSLKLPLESPFEQLSTTPEGIEYYMALLYVHKQRLLEKK